MAACRVPLVVVLGATGAGKSKLAIEIAKFFSGEIISADSMQIYKGLDIITNKVTEEEQTECPHHLISYLEADHKHYNIVDFRDAAVPIIDDLLKRRKLPVLVGGTNYYIESVLWNFLVDKKDSTLTLYDNPGLTRRFSDDQNTEDCHQGTSSQSSEGISVETPARREQINASEVSARDQSPAMKRAKLTTNSISETTCFSAGSAGVYLPSDFTSLESEPSVSSSGVASASSPDFAGPKLKASPGHDLKNTPTSSHKSSGQGEGIGQPSNTQGLSLAPQHQPFSQSHSASAATQRSGALHQQSQQSSDLCLGGQSDRDATPASQRMVSVLESGDPEKHHNDMAWASVSMSDSLCSESGSEANDMSTLFRGEVLPCDSVINSEGDVDLVVNSNPSGLSSDTAEIFGLRLHTGRLKDTGLPTDVSNEAGLSLMDVDIHGGVHIDYDTYDGLSSLDYDKIGLHSVDNDKDGVSLDPEDFRDDPQGLVRCLHGMSPEDLYSRLQQVDPVTASRQHPNNRRKIVRALQVFYQTGRTLSSILQEQHGGRGDVKSGPLRYPSPCILWVKCRQPDLDRRLDSRVDDMMKRGLVTELENFHKEAQRLEAEKNQAVRGQGMYTHMVYSR